MNTTTQTPAALEEAYLCQIEGTRDAVEAYGRTYLAAHFDAHETACKIAELRAAALHADFTMRQEMKAHKEITFLVREAEKLQAEVKGFQQILQAVEEKIYAKY